MKKLFLLTCLLFVSATVAAKETEETKQRNMAAIAEQCRLEAEESGVPSEEREQYIQDCMSQLSPQANDQQRQQNIAGQCRIEAEESGILPDEFEEYVQHCMSQQNPWESDSDSGDNSAFDMD